jgi:hypothetical protein
MHSRVLLPVRLLVWVTRLVSLCLVCLNLAPRAACAQGPPADVTLISGPH